VLLWKAVWSAYGILHLLLVASVGKGDTPKRLKQVEIGSLFLCRHVCTSDKRKHRVLNDCEHI